MPDWLQRQTWTNFKNFQMNNKQDSVLISTPHACARMVLELNDCLGSWISRRRRVGSWWLPNLQERMRKERLAALWWWKGRDGKPATYIHDSCQTVQLAEGHRCESFLQAIKTQDWESNHHCWEVRCLCWLWHIWWFSVSIRVCGVRQWIQLEGGAHGRVQWKAQSAPKGAGPEWCGCGGVGANRFCHRSVEPQEGNHSSEHSGKGAGGFCSRSEAFPDERREVQASLLASKGQIVRQEQTKKDRTSYMVSWLEGYVESRQETLGNMFDVFHVDYKKLNWIRGRT